MIHIPFQKFDATGNDFVVIDNRQNSFPKREADIFKICDRHHGIGADGVILLETNDDDTPVMKYFNSDGNEGSMCGNGGRAFTAFALQNGIGNKEIDFLAYDGQHKGVVNSSDIYQWDISLKMNDVNRVEDTEDAFFIDTGSPHIIKFIKDLDTIDVSEEGRKICAARQPNGTNVNFVKSENDSIYVRTYERGVEAETLSCGTGVTASAIASTNIKKDGYYKIPVKTKGGVLTVSFTKQGKNHTDIWLQGWVRLVFTGVFYL